MDIGKEVRELTVHPVEWPQPAPAQQPEPVAVPEPEPAETNR